MICKTNPVINQAITIGISYYIYQFKVGWQVLLLVVNKQRESALKKFQHNPQRIESKPTIQLAIAVAADASTVGQVLIKI